MNSAPTELHGEFVENGYLFKAYRPASDNEECAFLVNVCVQSTEKALFSYSVPMQHAPLFGVDHGDRMALEAASAAVVAQLPFVESYSETAFDLLGRDSNLKALGVTLTDLTK
jgi:hypothetical protein